MELDSREQARLKEEWQPIETAPKDGSRILVWGKACWIAYWREDAQHGSFIEGPGWQIFDPDDEWYSFCADEPTHWMPLPKPPSSLQAEGGSS